MSRKPRRGKAPLSLLPARALRAVSAALEYGDRKYSRGSWRGFAADPEAPSRYGDAALRHLTAWLDPSEPDADPESGLSHLAHAGACVLVALWLAGEDYREPASPAGSGSGPG